MSSVWLSVGTGVPPAYTIIDYVGCNHCLLSSYLCVWRPTTVCPQTVSVQLIAIIKSRLSFAADVHGHLLCFLYETTFCAFTAACVRSPLFKISTFRKVFSSYSGVTIILPCKNHLFHHELPDSSNFPDSLTPSEWWNTQAKTPKDSALQAQQGSSGDPPQLQVTLPAPQLAVRAAQHVISPSSPPFEKSSNTPQVGRRRPPTSSPSPSPTAIIQTHRAPNRPTMPAPPTIPARPTFSFANPPTTRNPSTPPPSRRFNPNSQSPDYGPPDDDQSPDYGPPDDEQSPDFDPPDDNQSPDYGPPDDDDLDDFGAILGATDNAGEGENSGENGNVEEAEAGAEAQHEAQNETTQQEPVAPKSTTKTSKSKSRKAKAKSGRVDKQSKPKPKPRSAPRPRRSRQTIETPSDAPARNTRSQTGGRGGRAARSGGSRFGYEELERVEREGRRLRREERERRGKGGG